VRRSSLRRTPRRRSRGRDPGAADSDPLARAVSRLDASQPRGEGRTVEARVFEDGEQRHRPQPPPPQRPPQLTLCHRTPQVAQCRARLQYRGLSSASLDRCLSRHRREVLSDHVRVPSSDPEQSESGCRGSGEVRVSTRAIARRFTRRDAAGGSAGRRAHRPGAEVGCDAAFRQR
jgi:hypothetical protein